MEHGDNAHVHYVVKQRLGMESYDFDSEDLQAIGELACDSPIDGFFQAAHESSLPQVPLEIVNQFLETVIADIKFSLKQGFLKL